MTCSGGDSAQGADEASRCGLELPALAPATAERLTALLPAAATPANPLDYTAMIWGDSAQLAELVRTVGEDPSVDQVVVFYDEPFGLHGAAEESWRAVREGIVAGAAVSPVPTIVSSTLPELLDDESAWRFVQAGVPAAAGLRTGLRCAAALRIPLADPARLRAIAAAARNVSVGGDARWLAEHEAKELLRGAGVPVIPGRLVTDDADAQLALAELGGHVAMKLTASSVQHKSELGAVELGIRGLGQLRAAYQRLSELARDHGGAVLVEQMASPGVELIVAARTDGIVPALVIGLGGIWTEMLGDVAVVPLPAGPERIARALRSLRGAAVLDGARGRPAADLDGAARVAARIGELLLERSLTLIELNPVIVGASGAVAVDAAVCAARAAAPVQPAAADLPASCTM